MRLKQKSGIISKKLLKSQKEIQMKRNIAERNHPETMYLYMVKKTSLKDQLRAPYVTPSFLIYAKGQITVFPYEEKVPVTKTHTGKADADCTFSFKLELCNDYINVTAFVYNLNIKSNLVIPEEEKLYDVAHERREDIQ